jgi:hypothetical protein
MARGGRRLLSAGGDSGQWRQGTIGPVTPCNTNTARVTISCNALHTL